MIRGTTPTLTFTTPYTANQIDSGYVTFKQLGRTVLEVLLSDESVTIEDYLISLNLTQKQTLRFMQNTKCRIQIRAILNGGKAVASNIVEDSIEEILKEGEIV